MHQKTVSPSEGGYKSAHVCPQESLPGIVCAVLHKRNFAAGEDAGKDDQESAGMQNFCQGKIKNLETRGKPEGMNYWTATVSGGLDAMDEKQQFRIKASVWHIRKRLQECK